MVSKIRKLRKYIEFYNKKFELLILYYLASVKLIIS